MITQNEIAKKLNVTQGAVNQWINGKTMPTLKFAIKLNAFFGFPYEIWGNREKISAWLKEQETKEKVGK